MSLLASAGEIYNNVTGISEVSKHDYECNKSYQVLTYPTSFELELIHLLPLYYLVYIPP